MYTQFSYTTTLQIPVKVSQVSSIQRPRIYARPLLLCGIVLVENQSPDLDRLSTIVIYVLRVNKSGMRHAPRSSVELGVVTLDQGNLIDILAVEVIPLVLVVGADGVRLALAGWVDQTDADEVGVRDTVGVGDGEGILEDLFDGTPDVDDLVAGGEELVGFGGEVVWDTAPCCCVRLIDVDAVDWATEVDLRWWLRAVSSRRRAGTSVLGSSTDRMIKNVDTRCTGSVAMSSQCRCIVLWSTFRTYASFNNCSISG